MKSLIKRALLNLAREWLIPAALMFSVVAPLKSAVVDWNWVPTGSMKPTILEGDLVLVNKLAYDLRVPFTAVRVARWGAPQRGDIVVFFSPRDGTRLVKRVVGLPGDTVEMRNDILILNGTPLAYSPGEAGVDPRDLAEDPHPVVAIENLGSVPHRVMALPSRSAVRTFGPTTVPAGSYFMMGDSRDNSADSRFIGPVPRDAIVGRANSVILSVDLNRFLLPRFDRFAKRLDP